MKSSAVVQLVRVVSLRLWLPLALLVSGLLLFALLLVMQVRSYERDLNYFATHTAYDELLRTKRALEITLRRDDGSGLDGVISELGLNPAITYAVLWDEHGTILAATNFAWKGEQVATTLPDYLALQIEKWRQLGREDLKLDIDQRTLTSLAPVVLGRRAGEVRSYRQGVLLILYDVTPKAAASWEVIKQQSWVFALVLMLSAWALFWLARWAILRPVATLRAAMLRIGRGEFSGLINIHGQGEFQELATELNRMAAEIEERRQALINSEGRFRQLSDASLEAIIFHENGVVIDSNSAAERLLNMPRDSLIGTQLLSLVTDDYKALTIQRVGEGREGLWEVDLLGPQGEIIPVEVNVSQRVIGGRTLRVVAARDIRPRLAAEETIRQLSQFDPLTGLPNRRMLLERVAQEVNDGKTHSNRAALAVINLDMFKSVNDSMGMAAGDTVLRAMAKRLNGGLIKGQLLARVVGDTFALLIDDLSPELAVASATAAQQVEHLLKIISEPLTVQGHTLHLGAGAGIVMIPNDSKDAQELLREAETAMHQAKQAGSNQVHFFAHALQQAASARLALRNDLQHTLSQAPQQLRLFYQPQVDATGKLLGVEALVRWQHPKRGLVAPIEFIGEAESSGLIVPLGNWVLEEAANCLKRWQQHPDHAHWAETMTMAVNVSPRQFREPEFVPRIEEILTRVGVEALSFELELTESVVADDIEATLEKIMQLRRLGIRFALDDFGTGYSSLSYLKRLPMDTLKIDRSFVMDIDAPNQQRGGKRPAVLIDAIISMAHQLDMSVLAEGVETLAQLERLRQAHCDIYQGYYFSKPLPETEFLAWARDLNPPV